MVRFVGLALALLPILVASTADARQRAGRRPEAAIPPALPSALSPLPAAPHRQRPDLVEPHLPVAASGPRLPMIGNGNVAIGAWSPAPSMTVGVGLYRVPKMQRLGRGTSIPTYETGSQNVPAVGFSLSF